MTTNALERLFETPTTLAEFFRPFTDWMGKGTPLTRFNLPAVNVTESDKAYRLSMAAPGLSKEDFQVDVADKTLVIRSEKELEEAQDAEKYTRREYRFQSFSRSFTLPDDVQADQISAVYKNGMLELTLPRKETTRTNGHKQSIAVQ